jgi:4-hydroxy-tetrahydrodipicolinate synthase
VPELTRELFQMTRAGRIESAVRLQYRLLELFDAFLNATDFPEGFRAAVELRGFSMGRSRQPLSPNQQVSRESMQRVLRCLMTDFGVEPPPEGCPSRSTDNGNPVDDIVERVVTELRKKGAL